MTKRERLSYTREVEKLAASMTLEEKIALMSGGHSVHRITELKSAGYHFNYFPFNVGGNERLGVPELCYCDGPRGVVCGNGKATCFPAPVMRGATFDTELEEEIGHAIGREARAFGANFFGGVCINLPFHPGWGRSQEVYGEDSFAMGAMGSALVRGVQAEHVIACLKHYAFNSIENSRFEVDIHCDRRTEREVFLPHFKDCVDAGAAAVMTAYNKYDGKICGHSEYLLNEVLRNDWDFDGIVISDFYWGISNTKKALTAGVDVEMPCARYYGEKLLKAVRSGRVDEELVDRAAVRIIRTMLAFERSCEESGDTYGENIPGCVEHRSLALKAACEGVTLIKNEKQTLPLPKNLQRIAVIGKLASKENTGDAGSSSVYPAHVVTLLEGIVDVAGDSDIICYEGDDLNHVKHLAAECDAVVYVVGMDYRDEGEYDPMQDIGAGRAARGGDRQHLGLHSQEVEMLKEAGPLNPRSVVVLMGGSTITVSEWEKEIPAILDAYYPGQEGGTAVAQILFGYVNPSGKLPFVLPEREEDLPAISWNTARWNYQYYHGYRYLDKNGVKPYRPYGFGLSYTTFALSGERFFADEKEIGASVRVKNTGTVAGDEVVQLYVGFSNSAVDRPVRTLCGFSRVRLQPGETKEVTIRCPLEKLRYYNEEKRGFVLEHMDHEVYIGTSGAEEDLRKGVVRL